MNSQSTGPQTKKATVPADGAPEDKPSPAHAARRAVDGLGPKIYAPDSPVDVPNRPAPQPPGVEDRAQRQGPSNQEERNDSSWADNTRAAPGKKNARTSIF